MVKPIRVRKENRARPSNGNTGRRNRKLPNVSGLFSIFPASIYLFVFSLDNSVVCPVSVIPYGCADVCVCGRHCPGRAMKTEVMYARLQQV